MDERETSKGHVMWLWRYEYYKLDDGTLVRAADYGYIQPNGYRAGSRFECTAGNADRHIEYLKAEERRFALEDGREPEPDARLVETQ